MVNSVDSPSREAGRSTPQADSVSGQAKSPATERKAVLLIEEHGAFSELLSSFLSETAQDIQVLASVTTVEEAAAI